MNTSPAPTKTSAAGIAHLKPVEGWSSRVYICPAGYPTIGWGHRVLAGERFDEITFAQGEGLLRRDLDRFERNLVKLAARFPRPLTQYQFDALVVFSYNIGAEALATSTLVKLLAKGRPDLAAKQFDRWINVKGKPNGGLVRRRAAERAMFEGHPPVVALRGLMGSADTKAHDTPDDPDAPAVVTAKPWWRSRVLTFNGLALALIALEANLHWVKPWMRDEYYGGAAVALAVVNAWLRTITTQPVTAGPLAGPPGGDPPADDRAPAPEEVDHAR